MLRFAIAFVTEGFINVIYVTCTEELTEGVAYLVGKELLWSYQLLDKIIRL
jgi:hypothetical protein